MPAGCRQGVELSTFGKAERVSILQERQRLRPRLEVGDKTYGLARLTHDAASLAAGLAMPLGATLALVWLATVGLVVINYFVPFNLVTLIYMLPVVVAATQWGLGPGIAAAIAGARRRTSSFIRRSIPFGSAIRKTSSILCSFS